MGFVALIFIGRLVFLEYFAARAVYATTGQGETGPFITPVVLFTGVVIAFVSIVVSSVSQWRSLRAQQTFQAIQTLRTDREYLLNALKIEGEITALGKELTRAEIRKFKAKSSGTTVENPSFAQASLFVLNQYEFIAAGCRLGLLDEELLRQTMRAGFCGLVETYRPLIAERRAEKPASLANLVWLYRRFSDGAECDLGPRPRFIRQWLLDLGKFIGVLPEGATTLRT